MSLWGKGGALPHSPHFNGSLATLLTQPFCLHPVASQGALGSGSRLGCWACRMRCGAQPRRRPGSWALVALAGRSRQLIPLLT